MSKKFSELVEKMSPEAQAEVAAGTAEILEILDPPIYLGVEGDKLVISQQRPGEFKHRVVLNQKQITAMVDTLLGPSRVKTITVDVEKLIAGSKS